MTDAPVYKDAQSDRVYRDAAEMVNDYLERFGRLVGVDMPSVDDQGYAELRRGSATVGVNVLASHGVLLLVSRVMDVPEGDVTPLYRRLLELNFLATSDAAFAIDEERNVIYVRALRRLAGLDYAEFEDLLNTVATVADEWDDRLQSEFA